MLIELFLIVICILLYYNGTRNFTYWESKGIKFCKPLPYFGNSFWKYLRRISPTDQLAEIYRSYPSEKYVGIFESNFPALVLRDPELIKHVFVSDFRYFYARGINMHQTEPLLNNVFTVDGDLWKLLRQKLSVAFTTGKLKAMYPTLFKQAERLEKIISDASEAGAEVDVRDLGPVVSNDAIVATEFGVDTNSLNDDSSVFRKLGKRIFNIKLRDSLVYMSKFIAADTFKNLKLFAPEIEEDIHSIVKAIFDARDNKPIGRKDYIDVLLDLQSKKTLVGDSLTKKDESGQPEKREIVLDDLLLTAQAFILFAAGYETSAASMSYTLHQLAYNTDIQMKCQEEIDMVYEKYGKLCYEAVVEMKYIEMVVKEGLRMFPPIGFVSRQCVEDYTFPGTNLTINKGVVVLISLQAMQNDEKYFVEPNKFIPERFHPKNADNVNKYSFLPFGAGPRTCLGMRFGMQESVLGLATVLSKFTVLPSVNTRRNLTIDPTTALVQNIKGGLPLKFVAR